MKYLWLLAPLLLSSCTSIQYVRTHDNLLFTQDKQPVDIVGNPPLACHLTGFNKVYTGYFMYQDDAGTIFLDDYGRGTIELQGDVTCTFLHETR
jgi:hypothetical protein